MVIATYQDLCTDAVTQRVHRVDVLGAERKDHEHGHSHLEPVPEAPFAPLVVVPEFCAFVG